MVKRKSLSDGLSLNNILPGKFIFMGNRFSKPPGNPELGEAEGYEGFRITCSHRAFNPFAEQLSDLIVPHVDARELITSGYRRQETAYEQGEVDEVEEAAPRHRPLIRSQTEPRFRLLSSLLAPVPLPCLPEPETYVADMSIDSRLRKKLKSRQQYRTKRRLTRREGQKEDGTSLKAVARQKIVAVASQPLVALYSPGIVPAGWSGPRATHPQSVKVLSVPDVLKLSGLKYIAWDGSKSRVIRTVDGTRFAVLGGHPGSAWPMVIQRLDQLCVWASQQLHLPPKLSSHRRGEYRTFGGGISFGNGRTEPGSFKMSQHNAGVFQKILACPDLRMLARYADHLLACYFPKVHLLLTNLLNEVVAEDPDLQRNFAGCCFAAFHLNMDNASTKPHTDMLNGFFTGCAVGALGCYNYRSGGHLILWDLGLVVEFPPGCVIILPSALITHSNIPVGPDERRHSVAFFTAAGLLRWYHNGSMSDKEFADRASKKQLVAWKAYKASLWEVGLEMLRSG